MSQIVARVPGLLFLVLAVAVFGIHTLPLLLGLYLFVLFTELTISHTNRRWLVDEFESLKRALPGWTPDESIRTLPLTKALLVRLWPTVSDFLWACADYVLTQPIQRWWESRGQFSHQGRHHAQRFARGDIAGTFAQREPGAALRQRWAETFNKVQSTDTGDQPVIADEDIHTWLHMPVSVDSVT